MISWLFTSTDVFSVGGVDGVSEPASDDDPLQENNITDVNKNTLIFCNRYFI